MNFSDETTFIIYSNEAWSERNFIQHQVALELSANYNVIFVNPPVLWDPTHRRRKSRGVFRINGNLVVVHYKHFLPLRIFKKIFRRINDALTELVVKKYIGESHEVVIWNFDRFKGNKFYLFHPDTFVYHIIHNKFDGVEDKEIARDSDLLLCSHSSYIQYYKKYNDNILHFPPCISKSIVRSGIHIDWKYNKDEKHIVYVGEINKDIDIDLLLHIAKNCIDYKLLILGPVIIKKGEALDSLLKLQILPNVRLLGSVPLEQVKDIVKDSYACVVPYKTIPGADYFNLYPRYLHLYMMAYKIVITTTDFGLDNSKKLGVFVESDYDAFIKLISSVPTLREMQDRVAIDEYLDSKKCAKILDEVRKQLTR
jgi:glycosyltransferase involved in cell wall biosynthesis